MIVVSPFSNAYGYGGSYYDSVLGNYGASPFDGLEASRTLYTRPFRSFIYAAGASQRVGFYESTIPYGDYQLRTRVRSRSDLRPWDLR